MIKIKGAYHETIQTKKVYIYSIKDNDGTPLDLINMLCYVQVSAIGASPNEA